MLATLPIPASTSCDNNSSSSHNHHPHQSYDDDAQQPQQQQQQPKHNSVVAIEEETPSVRSIATATTTRRTAPDTATATSTLTEGALLSSSSSAMQVSLQSPTTTAAAVPSPSQGKLRTLKRLYGRADEQRTILDAFQRAIEASDEANFILIQGDEGSGKTAVAQQSIEAQVIQNGGFFVTWKFNQVSPMESGDGFVQAFTSLTNQIMNSHDTVLQEIRRNLQSMGMVDLAIILEVMPMLQPVIGITHNLKPPNGVESSGRHMQIFRNMLRAMCTKDRPLVMFFDDVHFVDSCTITLLESIITDTQNDGAVFMASMGPTAGTANTNQPRADLHKLIQGFHEGGVNVTTIDLPPLNEQTTNLMVADILHVDCDISAPMTKFLHHYTQGNPRFLTELLTLMYDNGILVFEESTKTWNCDETKIDSIYQECRDFTTLVQSKLNRLAKPVKDVLKGAFQTCTRHISLLPWLLSC
jgi:predicted ATPase